MFIPYPVYDAFCRLQTIQSSGYSAYRPNILQSLNLQFIQYADHTFCCGSYSLHIIQSKDNNNNNHRTTTVFRPGQSPFHITENGVVGRYGLSDSQLQASHSGPNFWQKSEFRLLSQKWSEKSLIFV